MTALGADSTVRELAAERSDRPATADARRAPARARVSAEPNRVRRTMAKGATSAGPALRLLKCGEAKSANSRA